MEIINKELFDLLIEEGKVPFTGWDFSYITDTGRMAEFPLSWNYTVKVLLKVRQSKRMLDMGTGGGEYLLKLQPLPEETFVTEGYKQNIVIAKKRLEPHVRVFEVEEDNKLPFENDFFDLIINRHEAYLPEEVKRVMKDGAYFITQQVGGDNDFDLNRLLGAEVNNEFINWKLENAVKDLEKTGLKILEKDEEYYPTRFFDIGAIIYYLKAIPWQIEDFTVDNYLERLKYLHNKIQKEGYIDIKSHRFLIIAVKD